MLSDDGGAGIGLEEAWDEDGGEGDGGAVDVAAEADGHNGHDLGPFAGLHLGAVAGEGGVESKRGTSMVILYFI